MKRPSQLFSPKADPLCSAMVRFYEATPFWLYAAVTFAYLFVVPTLLRMFTASAKPSTAEAAIQLAIYGLLPPLGSFLGYRWLRSIPQTIETLVTNRVIAEKDAADVVRRFEAACKSASGIVVSVVLWALLCVLMWHAASKRPALFCQNTYVDVYVAVVSSIWWYILVRFFLVAALSFHALGNVMRSRGVHLAISMYHPDDCYGLRSVGAYLASSLVPYIVIVGTHLTLSGLGADVRMTEPIFVLLFVVYVGLPIYGAVAVLWPAHERMEETRKAYLDVISSRLMSMENRHDFESPEHLTLLQLRSKYTDSFTWPIGSKRAAALVLTVSASYAITIGTWVANHLPALKALVHEP